MNSFFHVYLLSLCGGPAFAKYLPIHMTTEEVPDQKHTYKLEWPNGVLKYIHVEKLSKKRD